MQKGEQMSKNYFINELRLNQTLTYDGKEK